MTVLLIGATGNVGPHVAAAQTLIGSIMMPAVRATADVERVLGRAPRSVEDYLRDLATAPAAV